MQVLAADFDTLEVQEELQASMYDIELMKESREWQAGIVDSIVERDMLQSMLSQSAAMLEQVHTIITFCKFLFKRLFKYSNTDDFCQEDTYTVCFLYAFLIWSTCCLKDFFLSK